MVFKKLAVPKTRAAFIAWYHDQTRWAEDHSYNDPANMCVALSNWFLDMIQTFPAMNGPYADMIDDDFENDLITDYCIGKDVIYVGFRWSVADEAYNTVLQLAKKHHVGFYDVSSGDGDILFPENGELIAIEKLGGESKESNVSVDGAKAWWKFW